MGILVVITARQPTPYNECCAGYRLAGYNKHWSKCQTPIRVKFDSMFDIGATNRLYCSEIIRVCPQSCV